MKFWKMLLILTISLISCKTSNTIAVEAQLNQGLEVGKCYFSIMQNNDESQKEKAFVLELVSPKYKDVEIFYSNENLKNFAIGNNKFRLPIKEAHSMFIINNESLSNFTQVKNPVGFLYCLAEVPSEYKIFSKQDLTKMGNKVIQQKVKTNSKIIRKQVSARPEKLLENQYYFEKGNWSELKEVMASSH